MMFVLKYIQKCCQTVTRNLILGTPEVVALDGAVAVALEDGVRVIELDMAEVVAVANEVTVDAEDGVDVETG